MTTSCMNYLTKRVADKGTGASWEKKKKTKPGNLERGQKEEKGDDMYSQLPIMLESIMATRCVSHHDDP